MTEQMKLYHERKRAGMCTYCGRERAADGRAMCPACLKRKNVYAQNVYAYKKAQRLCVACGQPLKETEKRSTCFACRLRKAEWWRGHHERTESR